MTLFVERGFDQVTVAEIAEAADVAASTVFNYFPSKESLVFAEETDREAAIIAVVHDRDPGTSAVTALHENLRRFIDTRLVPVDSRLARFFEISSSTPALRDYGRRMWLRHENALAEALAGDAGVEPRDPTVRALAHLVMETYSLIHQLQTDPRPIVDAAFTILAHGWDTVDPRRVPR